MAYNVVSCRLYPFRRENARFFSQELIEYVLFDFGHIWKPKRSKREHQLREVALYTFIPPVGRLVAYISRKYGGFVIMKSLNTWKYITSHRPSVRERMLCNAIVKFATKIELENDDLGLFAFMAIMIEYARLAVTSEQESLIKTVVDSLSFCLTDVIPGGFVAAMDRVQNHALNFEYPRAYVLRHYDPECPFTSPVSTDFVNTPRSKFKSPLMRVCDFISDTLYNASMKEIEEEFKKRELHREIFRRKMMVNRASQTELEDDDDDLNLKSVTIKSEGSELVVKVEVKKDENSDCITEGVHFMVKRCDIGIQTGNFVEEQSNYHNPEGNKSESKCIAVKSNDICSVSSSPVDSDTAIDSLVDFQKLQVAEKEQSSNTCTEAVIESEAEDPENGSSDNSSGKRSDKTSNPTEQSQFVVSKDKKSEDFIQEIGCEKLKDDIRAESPNLESLENQLQSVKSELVPSKGDTDDNESLGDSQLGSLDGSSDDPDSKFREDGYLKKMDDSFDSPLGSFDESISKSPDEYHLEN